MERKKTGFTLIEMIIVVSLTVVILAILTSMFIAGNKVFSNSDVKSTLQIEGQEIQENISKVGMEAVNIDSIKGMDGKNYLNISNKNTEISDLTYDKLILQHKLTDINGSENKEVSKENVWLSISGMTMNSYKVDANTGEITSGNLIPIIEYVKDSNKKTGKLSINGKELSSNVESIRIKPINIDDSNGTFRKANAISINIMLSKKKGYSDVNYPIYVEVKFRNNFIKQ